MTDFHLHRLSQDWNNIIDEGLLIS